MQIIILTNLSSSAGVKDYGACYIQVQFLAFLRELDLLSDYQSGFRKNMVCMGLEKSLKKHHFLEKSFIKKVFCTKERFESTAVCKFS